MAEVYAGTDSLSTTRNGVQRLAQFFTLRAALATTTSYVATSHMRTFDAEWVSLDFELVWVDSTSTQWYVEWSRDGTTWYRSLNASASAGTTTCVENANTLVSTATLNWNDGPIRVQGAYMRVSVKRTGGVGADTLAVFATLVG